MDYDPYHLRLIGERIGYDFPKGSVHEHINRSSMVLIMKRVRSYHFNIYMVLHHMKCLNLIHFFCRVENYIKDLWDKYNNEEFILSDIYSKRIYRKNLDGMNANKLFNYTIQLMETENNMKVLSELIPNIKDYKSKLILYSYDSFLFDFNMEDGLDYIKKVKEILEQKDKFPVKVSWGLNYHEMKDITEKFV